MPEVVPSSGKDDIFLTIEQGVPNFFVLGTLSVSKINHGSSHPCERKYRVSR